MFNTYTRKPLTLSSCLHTDRIFKTHVVKVIFTQGYADNIFKDDNYVMYSNIALYPLSFKVETSDKILKPYVANVIST